MQPGTNKLKVASRLWIARIPPVYEFQNRDKNYRQSALKAQNFIQTRTLVDMFSSVQSHTFANNYGLLHNIEITFISLIDHFQLFKFSEVSLLTSNHKKEKKKQLNTVLQSVHAIRRAHHLYSTMSH